MNSLLLESDSSLLHEFLLHLFQDTKDAIYVYEIVEQTPSPFLAVNQAACETLGYNQEQLMQLTPINISTPDAFTHIQSRILQYDNGSFTFDTDFIKQDGAVITAKVTSRIMLFNGRKIVISTIQDPPTSIYYDPITNLYNRQYIIDHLPSKIEHAKATQSQLSLLLLNLDQFKLLNNDYGYFVGDYVIKEVANRLVNTIADSGTVAYLGKDEFIIVLQSTSKEQVEEMAAHLLSEIEKPIHMDEQVFYLTASIGVSVFPEHGEHPGALKKNASVALDHAKERGGKHYLLFHPSMNPQAPLSLNLLNHLHKAITREEFILHYQPRIDTKTNQLIGAEALTRWKHPEKGIIPPSFFIPAAENSRMIIEIGNWVIQKVCTQIKAWQEKRLPPISISINLSARQLEHPEFIPTLKHILSQTGVDSRLLEFEITERVIVKESDIVCENLCTLRKMGSKISIDDFGTGYSSLSNVQRFPVDSIKIDRSFIQEIHKNSMASLVTSIIALGHNLHLKVVAEGVENETQLSFLKENGCDEWQGFLYSKPIPKNQFEQLLTSVS